jgi:tRNA (cytidine32/guanosine34-2'-O)-methyltransferase
VIQQKLESTPNARVIAVDLMEMGPLPGVIQIQGDITAESTVETILSHFHGEKAQLVVSDGAPDVLGMHDLDEYLQAQLVLAALNISLHLLAENGTFVAKIFRGKNVSALYQKLGEYFREVICAKPQASRNSSFEAFVVCRGFHLPDGFVPDLKEPLLDVQRVENSASPVPFRACLDENGYDADRSYPIDADDSYVHRKPLQGPINPPYARSLDQMITKTNNERAD